MSEGFVVWFTGLSGAGKSTLAAMLSAQLRARGVHVEVLDGDEMRTHLSKGLSFSREDRDTNIRRIGYVAKLVARSGACAMTAAISPYRAIRDEQRAAIGRFVEVYCRCDVPTLAERDPKGLYKKALAGEIRHFTGVDDPYEAPEQPDVVCDTAAETKEESLAKILARLEELGFAPHRAGQPAGRAAGPRLVAPHGGELVSRVVTGEARDALAESARAMPAIALDERGESDVEMIAGGGYSPLKGFMTSKEHLRVVREMRLENGLPWPVPITLAVGEAEARAASLGGRVALRARDGRIVAVLEIADRWTPDKELEAREVYRTEDPAHPGVAYLLGSGPVYLGGEIHVMERPLAALDPEHHLDPAATRAVFRQRGWSRVVGFHTDRPMLRAEEHITKSALEIADGLFIHPIAGAGDVPVDVRLRCYEALVEAYYPKERVVLSRCAAATRHAGPREALLQAITRKSYGCSHFIVERDHAAVGSYYGSDDTRAIFDEFAPGELGVVPLFFENAFYSMVVEAISTAKTAPGDASTRIELSGTKLLELLSRGEAPPPELARPEVVEILRSAVRG